MPRKHRKRSHSSAPVVAKDKYTSPAEVPITLAQVAECAIIPSFRSQLPMRYTFRFCLNNGVGLTTAFTTTMLLDMYCIATGGSATPVRIFNNIKLIGLKAWQGATEPASAVDALIIEFSPSTTGGFGGAPRVPYVATCGNSSRYAHLAVIPKKNELASQWFTAQQPNYVLWNMQALGGTVLQVDILATNVNGETPVACAYTSSVAKGSVGVTNFGVAGCRSVGMLDLVNP